MTAIQAETVINLLTYGLLAVCYCLGFIGGQSR